MSMQTFCERVRCREHARARKEVESNFFAVWIRLDQMRGRT
jgi:hypothetical protein